MIAGISHRRRAVPLIRAILAVALIGIAFGAAGALSNVRVTRAATASPGFGVPTTVSVGQEGFEPDLRIDTNNGPFKDYMFSSVPNGFATTISFMWRSGDHGQSWRLVPASSADGTGKLDTCVGGGDTEEVIDSQDRLYFNDLQGLTNFSTSRSTDEGQSFSTSTASPLPKSTGTSCASVLGTGVDRQWYSVDGDPYNGGHVFLFFDLVEQGSLSCPGSTSNELVATESPPAGTPSTVAPAVAGLEFGTLADITCNEGIMGNTEVSPKVDSGGNHYVFDVHDSSDFTQVRMVRCQQVSATTDPSGLQCTDHLVYSNTGANVGGQFVTMAIDKAGNLYAVWSQTPGSSASGTFIASGPGRIMMAYSKDNGDTWSTPVDVTAADPTLDSGTNTYPWVTAGDNGRIDIVWYGIPVAQNPSGAYGGDTLTNGVWNVYMAQSLAADSSTPGFTITQVSEKPIHYGTIYEVTQQATGDRTSGDFLNVRTGNNGEANITYVDSANDFDLGQDFFVRQNSGPSLYAADTLSPATTNTPNNRSGSVTDPVGATSTAPSCGNTDPAYDDASFDASGTINPQCGTNLDIANSAISVDPQDKTKLQVTMRVASLASLAPPTTSGGTVIDWLTAWHQTCAYNATTCPHGGHVWFAYMESVNGGTPTFFDGHSDELPSVFTTYPGTNPITSASTTGQCSGTVTVNCYDPTNGVIIIDVPCSDVGLASGAATPCDTTQTLYSVTASTLTQQAPANSTSYSPPAPASPCSSGTSGTACGVLFNTIDSAPAYDAPVTTGPTFNPVLHIAAKRIHKTVMLRWRVSPNSQLLGFNIFVKRHGMRVKLNKHLIAAPASEVAYHFKAVRPLGHLFFLEALGQNNITHLYGPIHDKG